VHTLIPGFHAEINYGLYTGVVHAEFCAICLFFFPAELEGFFYSVVSLFHVVSFDEVKEVVDAFCSKIVDEGTPENEECRLKM
jgi:hypothetical protein